MLSTRLEIFSKIKKKLFPFYKNKLLQEVFEVLDKDKKSVNSNAMFVGGCVRNYLENREADDIDVATIYSPEELKIKFQNTKIKIIETGIDHGSLTLINEDIKIEITSLRKDIKTDGRHAQIELTDDWKADSGRRDFTMNAIYLDKKGKIYDPQGGVNDFKNKIVKFIGDPILRIEEDYLRIVRYIRFVINYNSVVEKKIIDAIKLRLNGINKISKERILKELYKILSLKNFIQITEDEQLKKIFVLIFPEFKYINRLAKFKLIKHHVQISLELTLGILLVDETNNFDYFCHKYKTSNLIQENLSNLANSYINSKKDRHFYKKNLKKNIYLHGIENIKKICVISFLNDKNKNDKDFFKNLDEISKIKIPKFPYDGKYLIKNGFSEGKQLGKALRELEENWMLNDFKLSEEQAKSIIIKYS